VGWGGWRPGAGRKPASKRPPVHHVRRPPVPVLYGRYHHLRVLRTPREVRNALAYVLLNVRKHHGLARA
jgi:hypothetical protein